MRIYPAIEIAVDLDQDPDLGGVIAAEISDDQPLGMEGIWTGARISFQDAANRDRALAKLRARWPEIASEAVDVSDEDWAARSQAGLGAIVVSDEYIVCPPWDLPTDPIAPYVVIQPSMGFGTGHHASTQLCMYLMLRSGDLVGRSALDVGTGSGLLAIMAVQLGASRVVAIDVDPDAIHSAQENLELNQVVGRVDLRVADITDPTTLAGETFDLILANLTGTMLAREARRIAGLIAPDGRLVAGGFQAHEVDEVTAALDEAGFRLVETKSEHDWVGVLCRITNPKSSTAR